MLIYHCPSEGTPNLEACIPYEEGVPLNSRRSGWSCLKCSVFCLAVTILRP